MKKTTFLFVILFSACGLDLTKVDINLEDGFVPEVTVSSYLIPDSSVKLKLAMTRAAYSNHQTNPAFKSATIEQLWNNQIFVLSQHQKTNYIELFSNELEPKAGGIYKLRLETINPSLVLEAVDTIPEITPISDTEILPVDKSSEQLGRITFKPNLTPVTSQYYEVAVFVKEGNGSDSLNLFNQIPIVTNNQIITREDYYPSLLLIGAERPKSLLFRITNPAGKVHVDFNYFAPSYMNPLGATTIKHFVRIELRTVSYSYFRYKTSLYKQGYATSGDLLYGMAPPVTVIGNITGGLGIFSGYSKSDTIISVAGRTGLKN